MPGQLATPRCVSALLGNSSGTAPLTGAAGLSGPAGMAESSMPTMRPESPDRTGCQGPRWLARQGGLADPRGAGEQTGLPRLSRWASPRRAAPQLENPPPQAQGLNGYHWQRPAPAALPSAIAQHGLPPRVRMLLDGRGIRGDDALQEHLDLSLTKLPDPTTMKGMWEATRRLDRAIRQGEQIAIWGDYDVDGTCSAALVKLTLVDLGAAEVTIHIPSRDEGYGLNDTGITALARAGHRLLLTVDCGSTNVHEVALANALGMDVLIVDHHQLPAQLPAAHALLNPHQPGCEYPFKDLCAAGVAFMLMAFLREFRGVDAPLGATDGPPPSCYALLDLVAMATVADMVPMRGANRILVHHGLLCLQHNRRPGPMALVRAAKLNIDRLQSSDIGFQLGPRINASGRMEHARAAVALLLATDPQQAAAAAQTLEASNRARQQVQADATAAALEVIRAQAWGHQPRALVVELAAGHAGVLGLVAGELARLYHCPAVVLGPNLSGSARSPEGLNVYLAIKENEHLIARKANGELKWGGHPAAAGLTVAPGQGEAFRHGFLAAIERQPPATRALRIDLYLKFHEISLKTCADFESEARLAGHRHPAPVFLTENLRIVRRDTFGRNGAANHLKLYLRADAPSWATPNQNEVEAVGFNLAHSSAHLHLQPGALVDLVYNLSRSEFRQVSRVSLLIRDLRPCLAPGTPRQR